MPDFSKLLDKQSGQAKRPPVLPEAIYDGVLKSYSIGDANKNKTPYVRFVTGFTGAPDGVDIEGIDLSKRQGRADFYLTEDALFRLDEFLKSIGLDLAGKTYREVLPEAIGAEVKVEIAHFVRQDTGELGDQVRRIWGER